MGELKTDNCPVRANDTTSEVKPEFHSRDEKWGESGRRRASPSQPFLGVKPKNWPGPAAACKLGFAITGTNPYSWTLTLSLALSLTREP